MKKDGMVLQRAPQSATIFGFDATTEAEVGFQIFEIFTSQLFQVENFDSRLCLGICVLHSERKDTGCADGKIDSDPKLSGCHF